jgi:phosphonate metabolism protein PhnN/1,5-bisphosphokinase (PRPP-forming)
MNGLWVFVCGPSGAGKDSVIRWATVHLHQRNDVVFTRRLITRAKHPGSDHDAVTREQFAHLANSGGLAWHWCSHGFDYGISANYANDVAAGRVVVVNGSREHVHTLTLTKAVRVVQIEASPTHLAARLAQRRRDTPQEMAYRLARNAHLPHLRAHCTIVNQSALADAGRQLVDYLVALGIEEPSAANVSPLRCVISP